MFTITSWYFKCVVAECFIFKLYYSVTEPGINIRSCEHEGRVYQDGEDWKPDSCAVCRCIRGKVECNKEGCPGSNCDEVECPEIQCGTQQYIPLGQCCPICAGKIEQQQSEPTMFIMPKKKI